ncbi:hypothetical protein BS47DRAFT_1399302 [Hydnum rufescens UP504]|uniref:Uncharacterized protein n=1 Tax=Hydnum rufescens UP504 TaxID=1448309 RepID=A0A9P6DPT2_9AGAM|nr:hypothetical protein BS47DRAFT_1399302 [Hydnum rufescens UP504]
MFTTFQVATQIARLNQAITDLTLGINIMNDRLSALPAPPLVSPSSIVPTVEPPIELPVRATSELATDPITEPMIVGSITMATPPVTMFPIIPSAPVPAILPIAPTLWSPSATPPAHNPNDPQDSIALSRHWYLVTKGLQTGVFQSW